MPLLEFSDTQVEGNLRLVWLSSQRLAVFGRSSLKLPLLRECHAQVAMYQSIFRMLLFQLTPQQFCIVKLACSHQLRRLESEIILRAQGDDGPGHDQKNQP